MIEHRPPLLKMLCVITEQDKANAVEAIFNEHLPHLCFQFRGEGTASDSLLDMLGIGSTGKTLSLCIAPDFITRDIMDRLRHKLELILPGRGVAFTTPISGLTSRISRAFSDHSHEQIKTHMESEVNKLSSNAAHDLVLAVINQGFSEELMEAANEAGAAGGTVFHARRISPHDSQKFWGITIQNEKEIVAIIAKHSEKVELMKALSAKCGIASEAQGIILSLPVDTVAGFE